jgi:hypothetical protein
MVGAAQATSDREKDYDDEDDEKSYGKDRDEPSDEEKDDDKKSHGEDREESRDHDKDKKNTNYESDYVKYDDDKKSHGIDSHDSKYTSYKDDSKLEYSSSYGKDNNSYQKSKDISSSVEFAFDSEVLHIPGEVNTIEQLCPLLEGHTDFLIEFTFNAMIRGEPGPAIGFEASIDALVECLLEAGVIVEATSPPT